VVWPSPPISKLLLRHRRQSGLPQPTPLGLGGRALSPPPPTSSSEPQPVWAVTAEGVEEGNSLSGIGGSWSAAGGDKNAAPSGGRIAASVETTGTPSRRTAILPLLPLVLLPPFPLEPLPLPPTLGRGAKTGAWRLTSSSKTTVLGLAARSTRYGWGAPIQWYREKGYRPLGHLNEQYSWWRMK
jgi:hypothetical protein